MHFKHNPTDVLGLSGLRCRPGADRSLTFAARIEFHAGDSYPAVETDPAIQRGQKILSRERKRAVSIALATLPLSVPIPRANIAAPSEALGLGASARAAQAEEPAGCEKGHHLNRLNSVFQRPAGGRGRGPKKTPGRGRRCSPSTKSALNVTLCHLVACLRPINFVSFSLGALGWTVLQVVRGQRAEVGPEGTPVWGRQGFSAWEGGLLTAGAV